MASITVSNNTVLRGQYLQIDGSGFTANTTADIHIAAGPQLFLLQGAAALTATGSFSVPVLFGDNLPYGTVYIYAKDTSGVQSSSIAVKVIGENNSDGLSGNDTDGDNNAELSTWQTIQQTVKPFLPLIAGVFALAIIVILIKRSK